MTEEGLDVLFDIQDDEVAQRVAVFTAPDSDDCDSYLAKLRKIVASDEITKKVNVLEGIRWSASPSWARFRRAPATGGTATRSPIRAYCWTALAARCSAWQRRGAR